MIKCNRMMRQFHALVSYLGVIFRQTVRVLSSGHTFPVKSGGMPCAEDSGG
jgi:hypothetical protein